MLSVCLFSPTNPSFIVYLLFYVFSFVLCFLIISSQGEGLPLLPGEKKEIVELLPATTSEEDKDTVFSILGQAMCRPTGIQV